MKKTSAAEEENLNPGKVIEKIRRYFKQGWKVMAGSDHVTCFQYYIEDTRGNLYGDRLLSLNLCTICEDVEIEGCSGWHSKEDLREERKARRLNDLIKSLPLGETFRYLDVLREKGLIS